MNTIKEIKWNSGLPTKPGLHILQTVNKNGLIDFSLAIAAFKDGQLFHLLTHEYKVRSGGSPLDLSTVTFHCKVESADGEPDDETIVCHFCRSEIAHAHAAIDAGWIPSFYPADPNGDEIEEAVCPACQAARLEPGADGIPTEKSAATA